ncbi:TPA: DNA methyltransferase [Pseudomonas aeruginosa]
MPDQLPYTLHLGDCLQVLRTIPDNSIDSVVTDPPYGLAFMGNRWDYDVPAVAVWAECLRVLKPGGYMLAFGGTRTFHRLAVRVEDAGFTLHPLMAWLFGSGFPKATRVELEGMEGWRYGLQSLKPALEPICFAQKPMSEKTGTANVARWGTGAVNIDACRIPTDEALQGGSGGLLSHVRDGKALPGGGHVPAERAGPLACEPAARWIARGRGAVPGRVRRRRACAPPQRRQVPQQLRHVPGQH